MARLALLMGDLALGGVERVMLDLATAFAQAGHATDLLACRVTAGMRAEVPAQVRLVELPRARRSVVLRALVRTDLRAAAAFAWRRIPSAVRAVPGLVDYLNAVSPAALLSATPYVNVAALWARRLARGNAAVVVAEHTHLSARLRSSARREDRALPAMMARSYRRADAVVAVSQGIAADLAALRTVPARRPIVIYNPVRPVAEDPGPPPHPWLCPGEPPVVLGVGRLHRQKSFATLLHAFALLRRERPARLLILGEGAQRGQLEDLARTLGIGADFALPGFVQDPYRYFARASVFALSSRYEGLPLALMEALACGCPVVSTDCPSGPDEILEGGRYGALVPVNDPAAFAQALATTLDHPHDPDRLRRRAAAFSPQQAASAYLALLLGSVPVPEMTPIPLVPETPA